MEKLNSLSNQEVREIVKNRLGTENEFKLAGYQLEHLNCKTGYLGVYMILKVKVATDNESIDMSFFVKFIPDVNDEEIIFANTTRAYHREIFFYKTLIGQWNQCVPIYYYSIDDSVIVLENLIEKGFVTLNKREVLDYPTVKKVIETLSELHALSLIWEENQSEKSGQTYRLNQVFGEEFEERVYANWDDFVPTIIVNAAIEGFLKIINYYRPNQIEEESARKFCRTIFDLAQPSGKYRNVICHGDLWATNVLIRENGDCRLVDFQAARYTPPSFDVLSFLHLTTTRDFRKKYLEELLDFYYENLGKRLKSAGFNLELLITFEDFLASCREAKKFGIIQAAQHLQFVILESDVLGKLFENPDFAHDVFYKDRSLIFFENVDKDEFYKMRLKDVVDDFLEFCVLD